MENTQERKYERMEGKFEYLNNYLGKPILVNWGKSYLEGTLHDVNPERMTATVMPTILYNLNGKPYIEEKTPTTLSLHLFDLTKMECMIQPIRSLEERVAYVNQLNVPKAKIGFGG